MTLDTNVAVYALSSEAKREQARETALRADFISVQVLNEYAFVARRKVGRSWREVREDIVLLRKMVGAVRAIAPSANATALRLAERYQLGFFDALMIAVALANGATVLYSGDMHHGLVVENRLTVLNPFLDLANP